MDVAEHVRGFYHSIHVTHKGEPNDQDGEDQPDYHLAQRTYLLRTVYSVHRSTICNVREEVQVFATFPATLMRDPYRMLSLYLNETLEQVVCS